MFTRVESFFEVYEETKYLRGFYLTVFAAVHRKLDFWSSSCILSKFRLFVRSVKQGCRPIVGGKLMVPFFV
eukprot:snap_masked-scaffold_25-processed-gene-3.6-mRNA-1 protein AED:1.00 eAED:1.00 QI:0/0/0/0/1/1/2/0/70